VRSFCGDASGVICFSNTEPVEAIDGACPVDCTALR
jgi:hypothetical protein